MTFDTFRPEIDFKTLSVAFTNGRLRLNSIFTFIEYVGIFVGYAIIFIVSLLTIGFLEIRQANMGDFNALIAVLDQRDRYKDNHLDKALERLRTERDAYSLWVTSLVCSDSTDKNVVKLALEKQNGDPDTSNTNSKTCAEIKESIRRHAKELSLTEDEVRFRSTNLAFYYDSYEDGITQKAPQIIPALRLLDSKSEWLTLWARSPFELIEMFLLVCMGLLGGVISVMRCFVDPLLKTPAIAEFFYKPAAGAAISLGVYVLFRAAQIFLGVQNQNGAATVSTSIFLLAGLGLASGFCATEALAQIEIVATRLLRTSGRGRSADNPEGPEPDHRDSPNPGLTAAPTP